MTEIDTAKLLREHEVRIPRLSGDRYCAAGCGRPEHCEVRPLAEEIDRLREDNADLAVIIERLAEAEAERDASDSAATYWYGKWVEVSVERDEAIAGRNRWRDSWESGDWSREQWERDRAQESDEARRQDAEHSPDRQHRYWPWGADDTCGAAVQDPGTRSMRACRRPKNDPLHGEERADV